MFPDFPLYMHLYSSTMNSELSNENKEFLVSRIPSVDHEIVIALIYSFYIHNEVSPNINVLPFGLKHQKKGIKVDLESLPVHLQNILYKFVSTATN